MMFNHPKVSAPMLDTFLSIDLCSTVPTKADIALQLTQDENQGRRGYTKGAASWILSGLKIEEQR